MLSVLKRKANSFIFNRTPIGEVLNGFYDIYLHNKYSFSYKGIENDKSHLSYYLTKNYHIIEKGLSLPKPRYGFGQPKIIDTILKLQVYQNLYGNDKLTNTIKKTLSEYLSFHENNSYILPQEFESTVKSFLVQNPLKEDVICEGGLKFKSRDSSSNISFNQFKEFVESRSSVRDFSEEDVCIDTIHSIIEASKSAPSVCNRQAWKVHIYSNKNIINKILSHQNGNLGFRNSINKLIIVTGDIKGFTLNEHNQIFIDGGLFCQNILLAIHAAGLGGCPLNTCYNFCDESKVKLISHIPDNERLIMMIAIGCLKEKYKVAYSARKVIEDIVVNH